ncbi:sulfurtransferase complex subunit TusB [Gibbsiella quercinecans]|uniref:sulfurtransferase complex subunit TusB n=1 Tax=Gibbsiella quercinecans TaxID=929813 RepID=UPI00242B4A4A|nr:sulfurtransferase complex subunit TusB [Gibbsiella quercinecans]
MLFTLSHSPTECDLPALLRLAQPGDALLLLQDGVLAALAGSLHLAQFQQAPVVLFALRADVEARGLSGYISHYVTVIGYTEFVELTEKHPAQTAW